MERLAPSGVDREMICLLPMFLMPSASAVIVPMNTRVRWSMLAPICSHMEAVTTFCPCQAREAAREHVHAVELRVGGDAVHLVDQGGDLHLDLHAVLVGVDAVGRLHRELAQPLDDVLALLEVALRGLDEGDAVGGVGAGLAQAADLAAHLLRDGQARGVVARAGDPLPEESFSMFLSGAGR